VLLVNHLLRDLTLQCAGLWNGEVVLQLDLLLLTTDHLENQMCCGLWHVTLLSTQSIWERCWQRQVSLQNIHVAIVSIPYRFKCLWCPSVKLHENQTHCETMGKDNKSIVVLVIWVDIFSSNLTVPPTLSTVKDVCTTFSSGETVKEASDTALLFAKGFEIVTLQITWATKN